MALHGKTSIELYDAKTGKLTDKVEKDNFITDGVQKYLLQNFIIQSETSVLNAFRNLLIFNKNIDATKTEPEFTSTMYTSLIGYGGTGERIAGNSYMGSFNAVESDLDVAKKSIKLVWDFTTDACNNDIGAICLAPDIISSDNNLISINQTYNVPYINFNSRHVQMDFGSKSINSSFFITSDAIYVKNRASDDTLSRHNFKLSVTNIDLSFTARASSKYVSPKDIKIPTDVLSGLYIGVDTLNRILLNSTDITVLYNYTQVSGLYDAVFRVVHVDYSYTDYNVKVKTSYSIHGHTYNISSYDVIYLSGLDLIENKIRYSFFTSNPEDANTTDVYLITIDTTTGEIISDDYILTIPIKLSSSSTTFLPIYYDTYSDNGFILNIPSIQYLNIYYDNTTTEFSFTDFWGYLKNPFKLKGNTNCGIESSTNYQTIYTRCNFVTTVNNQDDILTKTPDKTMKIVYTITEE